MIGGVGNDTYDVSDAGDTVQEDVNGGFDTVDASINYTLAANVEAAYLEDSAHQLQGNGLDNSLYGNTGDDTLLGGGGNDMMIGGDGNDTYEVTDAGDQVVENVNGGFDTVYTTLNYTLAANVEAAYLEQDAHVLQGNGLDNILVGNVGDDTLLGGGGNDTMIGGGGNDTYEVTEAGDQVVESANGGFDTVYTTVNYALAANVEAAYLEASAHQLQGNSLDNILVGNVGDDTLLGGGGNDTMIGGAGNDTYEVTDAGDQVVENVNGGFDTVYTTVNYALAANVEAAYLEGSAHQLQGNGLDNVLYGNAGDDVLLGGSGNDLMIGGAGNDIYEVTDAGDTIQEGVNGGIDSVYTTVNLSLAANVENAYLEGNAHLLSGNASDNTLVGNSGNDVLFGGAGNDTLTGGAGSDTFAFNNGDGNDVITDFNPAAGGDIINLHGYSVTTYAALQGLMTQSGSDVVITFDASNHLTLHGLLLNQLSSGDFFFG
jgi:Ca2+-binding RTX toxin-like protein